MTPPNGAVLQPVPGAEQSAAAAAGAALVAGLLADAYRRTRAASRR